jgi:hypothetical protein
MQRHLIYRLANLIVFLLAFNPLFSQVTPSAGDITMNSKWYVGGGFGLSFGNQTSIYLAPELSRAITDNFHIGVGVSYEYYNNRLFIPARSINTYGGKLFARYFIFDNIFVAGEYEKLWYRDNYINPGTSPIITLDNLFAGAGYRQWVGINSFMTIALMFNVLDERVIFGINPMIRFGIAIGI